MYKLKCYWAGMLIREESTKQKEKVDEIITHLKNELRAKNIRKLTCGVNMIVTTLCIDVYKDDTCIAWKNISA